MRIPPLTFVLTLALAAAATAQPPAPQAPSASPAAAAPAGAPDSIKAILDQELQPAPGAYTYNPQGRRDPFVSLQKPVEAQERGPRAAGIAGMLIQEIALKGIVRTPKGYTAMMQGTDGKSYFVTAGQRLADGQVVSIDAATVVFRQELNDPLSTVKSREIKKSLYQSEEAR
jgi:type IV pilus assembly protein PilP